MNGLTRTCGVIGCPIEHTKSPLIQNTLAEMMGINLCYVPFNVQKDALADAIKGANALQLLGLNITVPYKSDVIPYLKEIDPLAMKIGAVNTLVSVDGGYKGYNTDMPGLYRAMVEDGVEITDHKVIILGAGGVARAVALLMADKDAQEIILMNRTLDKAEQLCREVKGFYPQARIRALALTDFNSLPMEKYLVVQATSIGMHPNVEEAVIEDAAFYERVETGYDLVFNPAKTKFMKLAEDAGARAYNGLKMLLYQGVIGFEYWTKTKVPKETIAKVYELLKENA